MENKFDDIRPYYDEEVPAAMERIANNEYFPVLASFVFPGRDLNTLKDAFLSFKTAEDFQSKVMSRVNEEIIKKSITSFTYSGLEHLDNTKKHLFISNHRDIMLDASLLQQILHRNGMETTEITFGSNLMTNQLIVDIGKSNKMFRVERSGSPKEFYRSSEHLSEYIRYTIMEKKQSVWIAQRNGRTKDGNDVTEQGIINMLCMSNPTDKIKALDDLSIIPVSVSYEWEPCDILKILEMMESRDQQYTKKPGEDLNSILTGIIQFKGNVHFHICDGLRTEELNEWKELRGSRYSRKIAELIDRRILSNYHLFPNNYIAYDMKFGTSKYKAFYTDENVSAFRSHLDKLIEFENYKMEDLVELLLNIYSNPVENYNKCSFNAQNA